MRLLLDIGNTNLRWALDGPDGPGAVRVARHGGGAPLDLLADWEALRAPSEVLASNVGGAGVAEALTRVTRAYWGLEPGFVSVRDPYGGLRVAYADPSRLGVDRWLAMLAGRALAPGPVLVADVGTAVTLDLVLGDGRHLGGFILPGLGMMRDGLLERTHVPPPEPLGGLAPDALRLGAPDTGAAIAAGGREAIAALIDRMLDRLAAEAGGEATLVLTGGDLEGVAGLLERPYRAVPDLVLRGLARVAEAGGWH